MLDTEKILAWGLENKVNLKIEPTYFYRVITKIWSNISIEKINRYNPDNNNIYLRFQSGWVISKEAGDHWNKLVVIKNGRLGVFDKTEEILMARAHYTHDNKKLKKKLLSFLVKNRAQNRNTETPVADRMITSSLNLFREIEFNLASQLPAWKSEERRDQFTHRKIQITADKPNFTKFGGETSLEQPTINWVEADIYISHLNNNGYLIKIEGFDDNLAAWTRDIKLKTLLEI